MGTEGSLPCFMDGGVWNDVWFPPHCRQCRMESEGRRDELNVAVGSRDGFN